MITTDGIIIVESIYGAQVPIIQGKAIRRSPEHHKIIARIPLPPLLSKQHKNMELSMDFFYVNGSPLFHTKSNHIYFREVQECNNREKSKTVSGLKQVKTKYKYRAFITID